MVGNYCVYIIRNSVNSKVYIGFTSNLKQRWIRHRHCAKKGVDTLLYRAMRKHGADNFSIAALREGIQSKAEAQRVEISLIAEFQSLGAGGYNLTSGGDGGDMSNSAKFQKAIKRVHAERTPSSYATHGMLGKSHSEETRSLQSSRRREYWSQMSDSQRINRGLSIMGSRNGMHGKTPKNACPISFRGVQYSSITSAVRSTNFSANYIKKNRD